MRLRIPVLAVLAAGILGGCASLSGLGILAPRFEIADEQGSEIRLLGPSLERPIGGAAVRLYTRVENPNPVGITLTRLAGTLRLEGFEAADADFPLGLPLAAGASAVVPLEIAVSFANLPGLADVLRRAAAGGEVAYSLRGTTSVDAGVLGQPTFGPMTFLSGAVELRR
ncbi:MAG TPA: LEA type 2 family protein [Longimicrobiaceae bacterium]|nr:LEA type 2 family protein [Longimicrobiaceae bacterium]